MDDFNFSVKAKDDTYPIQVDIVWEAHCSNELAERYIYCILKTLEQKAPRLYATALEKVLEDAGC